MVSHIARPVSCCTRGVYVRLCGVRRLPVSRDRTRQARDLARYLTGRAGVEVTLQHRAGARWDLGWADGPTAAEMVAELEQALRAPAFGTMESRDIWLGRVWSYRGWAATAVAAFVDGDLPLSLKGYEIEAFVDRAIDETAHPERARSDDQEPMIEQLLRFRHPHAMAEALAKNPEQALNSDDANIGALRAEPETPERDQPKGQTLPTSGDQAPATLIGYARCSTEDQDLAAQRQALIDLGVDEDQIYLDHGMTGANRDRPGLAQALAAVRAGDTLVVPKLDRLARSVPDAREIGDSLARQGVALSLGGTIYDPNDPIGKMFFNILATFAEFELDLLRARTREGMAIAKAKGKLRGRQPKLNKKQQAVLRRMYESGQYTGSDLAEIFGVSRATIYRTINRATTSTTS